jgi:hypothetical protein
MLCFMNAGRLCSQLRMSCGPLQSIHIPRDYNPEHLVVCGNVGVTKDGYPELWTLGNFTKKFSKVRG